MLKKIFSMNSKNELFLIIILGPDGAGKTTLIKNLMEKYKSYSINYYAHLYPNITEPKGVLSMYPYGNKTYSRFISFIKILYMIIKNIFYYFTSFLKIKEKTIIWCDRYIYDVCADPKRFRVLPSPLNYFLIKRLSIIPNLIFIINPPVDEIIKRSNELSKAELSKLNKSYNKLKSLFPKSILINDIDSIDKISNKCSEYIEDFFNI